MKFSGIITIDSSDVQVKDQSEVKGHDHRGQNQI